MSRLDDRALVAREYADDARLRRRVAAFTGENERVDARVPALDAVAEVGPSTVLEVGCGWGELALRIARETDAEVTAVDLSPHMVDLARAAGVDAHVGDVQQLEFDDATFDCVVAAWMLYHVPDLHRGLAEVARVLRPGGRFVAITNSATHLRELRELVRSGPSPSTFTTESGAALLGAHFSAVHRIDVVGQLEFATHADVVDYVCASISMSPFVANLPEEIIEPFAARRASSIFVADKAP